nr:hypothetical protein [Ardenticatenia bacterium]
GGGGGKDGGGGGEGGGWGGGGGPGGGGETRAFDQAAREGEQLLRSHYGNRLPKGADMERVRSLAFGPPRQALKQGQSLTSQAHQAGYRGEGAERRYMAGRAERAAAPAIGRTPVFGPDPGATVASPTSFGARPDVRDFDQGQRMATALKVDPARGADLALMHHGLRSGAVNPEKGHEAAQGFSRSMCELGTSGASPEEIRAQAGRYLDEFGGRAGVPPQRLEAWKARLTSMQPQIGGV